MSGGSRPTDEGGAVSKKKCFSALRASVSSNNKAEASPPGPFPGSASAYSRSRGGGYSHTLPIQVCAAQRGRDFEAPDLERGIHFRGVF